MIKNKEKKCHCPLELYVNEYIDRYDYHDAQDYFRFYCELDKDHPDMHMVTIKGQSIFWEQK